jgi:hypothetical protein
MSTELLNSHLCKVRATKEQCNAMIDLMGICWTVGTGTTNFDMYFFNHFNGLSYVRGSDINRERFNAFFRLLKVKGIVAWDSVRYLWLLSKAVGCISLRDALEEYSQALRDKGIYHVKLGDPTEATSFAELECILSIYMDKSTLNMIVDRCNFTEKCFEETSNNIKTPGKLFETLNRLFQIEGTLDVLWELFDGIGKPILFHVVERYRRRELGIGKRVPKSDVSLDKRLAFGSLLVGLSDLISKSTRKKMMLSKVFTSGEMYDINDNYDFFKKLKEKDLLSEDNIETLKHLVNCFLKTEDYASKLINDYERKYLSSTTTTTEAPPFGECNLGLIIVEISKHLKKRNRKALMTKYGFSVGEKEEVKDNIDFFEKLKEKRIIHEDDVSELKDIVEQYILCDGRATMLLNNYERLRHPTESSSSTSVVEEVPGRSFSGSICFDKEDAKLARVVSYMIETRSSAVLNMLNSISATTGQMLTTEIIKQCIVMDASVDDEIIQLFTITRMAMDAGTIEQAHNAGNTRLVKACLPYMVESQKLNFLSSVASLLSDEKTLIEYLNEFNHLDVTTALKIVKKHTQLDIIKLVIAKLDAYYNISPGTFLHPPIRDKFREFLIIVIQSTPADSYCDIFKIAPKMLSVYHDIVKDAIENTIESGALYSFRMLICMVGSGNIDTLLVRVIQKRLFPFALAILEEKDIKDIGMYWVLVIDCNNFELAEYFIDCGVFPTANNIMHCRANKDRISDELMELMEDIVRDNAELALELVKMESAKNEGQSGDDDDDDDVSLCAICMVNKKVIVAIPCGHVCYCEECRKVDKVKESKKCPMCRADVSNLIRVYI